MSQESRVTLASNSYTYYNIQKHSLHNICRLIYCQN